MIQRLARSGTGPGGLAAGAAESLQSRAER